MIVKATKGHRKRRYAIGQNITSYYFARGSGCEVLWWAGLCVGLSVREHISGPHARSLQIFVHVAYGPGSVLLQQSDEIPRKGAVLGIFFPIGNALYSIATGTHTKTAEPIEMPFGTMSGPGP